MTRLVILIVLAVVAVAIAGLLQRRRPEPPSAPSYRAPSQLDRSDFAGPLDLPIVVVFASSTCNSCPVVWDQVSAAQRPSLAIERVTVQEDPKRHERYRIDGVPTTIVADADGVVVETFFGPLLADALEAAIDEVTGPR